MQRWLFFGLLPVSYTHLFDTLLAHTGQNYDYNLNGVFFHDLELEDPDIYLNAVGADLGETLGNIIAKSYQLMAEIKPDAVLAVSYTHLDVYKRQGRMLDAIREGVAEGLRKLPGRPMAVSYTHLTSFSRGGNPFEKSSEC